MNILKFYAVFKKSIDNLVRSQATGSEQSLVQLTRRLEKTIFFNHLRAKVARALLSSDGVERHAYLLTKFALSSLL